LIAVMKLISAPAMTPGSISGRVTFRNAREGRAPKLIAASSMPLLICFWIAALERTA
jgi:hypothetical protein